MNLNSKTAIRNVESRESATHAPSFLPAHFPIGPLSMRLLAFGFLLSVLSCAAAEADPYRGLWVGRVKLSYVNEVSIPLNSNNVPVAPNPKVTTPTFDDADLRLILHVNGAGQVSLLKDVAILNRNYGTNVLTSENDLALVTDETLYGKFPPQPAQRIASAVFDFGDRKATDAVNAIIDAVVTAVVGSVATNTANLASTSGRTSAETAASQRATQAATPIAANADVANAFDAFLRGTNFNSAVVNGLAVSANPVTDAQAALNAATNLESRSFYSDSRAIEMINAVLAALATAGTNPATRQAIAQNTAASFADITNGYQRFIAGKQFGDMITAAADAAAHAATNVSATLGTITNAINGAPAVTAAKSTALTPAAGHSILYTDTRGSSAIQLVLDAIAASANSALTSSNRSLAEIQANAQLAGHTALSSSVLRYELASEAPTPAYNEFVLSSTYLGSVNTAASAAAEAAVLEKKNNVLYTSESLADQARLGAVKALGAVLSAAARAVRNELAMDGTFAVGAGDPRLTWAIKQTNAVVTLNAPALTATISLPANHPTNPFRHRRHPDHTVGFDITRNLRLDFDGGPTAPLSRSGYGVDRISGIYREEIFGLHKPLGPEKDTGLRVEGTFELNRISLIDTLNAR